MSKLRRLICFALLTAVYAASAQAPSAESYPEGPSLLVSASARPGDPLFATLGGAEPGFSGRLVLLSPTGAQVASARSFSLPGRPGEYGFALGLQDRLAAGAYKLNVETGSGTGARTIASASLRIQVREFKSRTVKLTPDAEAARDAPDPRREEQSKRYQAVIDTFDPAGVRAAGLLERPVFTWPLASLRRTAGFGDRRRYVSDSGGSSESAHWGLDFGAPTGTEAFSPGPGKVVLAEFRVLTGNTVILEHLPGTYSIFMHMDSLAVKVGDLVDSGSPIGRVGSTGFSTGPHLHWELRVNGIACDPEALVAKP